MTALARNLDELQNSETIEKADIVDGIIRDIKAAEYTIAEINAEKPWGAYIRIANEDADRFVEEFFPGLTPEEARLGVEGAELSPKILLVSPRQRLSWQYHNRRAERWRFLTAGAYKRSETDEEGDVIPATAGDVVQFAKGERHRLIGIDARYAIVAEIWQHVELGQPSNEDDIVRVSDDYNR